MRPSGVLRPASGVLIALLLGGCGREAPPVQDEADAAADALALAQQVVAHHGSAANLTAQLLLRVKPAGQDAQIATINAWSPADGRTRLSVTRVGFSGVEALIGADGSVVAVTRENQVVRDTLRTAFAEVLGAAARPERLIEDLKAGPLPLAAAFERTAAGLACIDPGTGLRVEVDLAPDGVTVTGKTWFAADGEVCLRIAYQRPQVFDGLRRSASWTVSVPGVDAQIQLRIQELDVVPQIGEDRLRLTVPAGAPEQTIAAFFARPDG